MDSAIGRLTDVHFYRDVSGFCSLRERVQRDSAEDAQDTYGSGVAVSALIGGASNIARMAGKQVRIGGRG